jgi:glycosyltransferase involved in cell wall biosynthesis
MKTTVTIVMPVFNSQDTIKKAIISIKKQSYRNWKLIIIDDFSNDKTFQIAQKYKSKKIIVLKNKKNLGLTKTLNKIIANINTKYIARMDGDDESLPKRLEKQIKFLNKNPDVSLLGCNANYFNYRKKFITKSKLPLSDLQIKKLIIRKNVFIHSSVIFKKKFYRTLKGYDNYFLNAQDYDLWLRGRKKFIYANLPDCLLNHTIKQKIGLKKLAYGILAMIKNLSFDKYLLPSLFFIFLSIISIILRKFGIKGQAI